MKHSPEEMGTLIGKFELPLFQQRTLEYYKKITLEISRKFFLRFYIIVLLNYISYLFSKVVCVYNICLTLIKHETNLV